MADQLEHIEESERAPRRRLRQPRAADRRPAGRARAGDHDRRRLPLVRDAAHAASSSRTPRATSSTRATWSPARRPPTSRSCCSTRARAWSSRRAGTPTSPRRSASRTSSSRSTRWTSSTSTRSASARSTPTSTTCRSGSASATSARSRSRRSRATTSSDAPSGCRGGPAARCSSTSSGSRSPATATSHRRFPVQWVIRPMTDEHHDYRGYAGQVAGGVWRAGDEVVVLPSGLRTTVAAVETYDGPLEVGVPGQAVVVTARGRRSTSRAATCSPTPPTNRWSRASSRRRCAGCASGPSSPAPGSRSSTPPVGAARSWTRSSRWSTSRRSRRPRPSGSS